MCWRLDEGIQHELTASHAATLKARLIAQVSEGALHTVLRAVTKSGGAFVAAAGNAVGRVELDDDHAKIGYMTHPAVADSCMHLGVFAGSPDGQTRVPGGPPPTHICPVKLM